MRADGGGDKYLQMCNPASGLGAKMTFGGKTGSRGRIQLGGEDCR